ncbi:hypothetical protein AGDE_14528 [Angomonas deanei]|uniref:Kinesin-like protein n=1 Tax=Angomonas deanei TaxID=59799 RepID=A0A7G2C8P1_9TRYP|nr:hypothetical protein AGDE_14528 [Angomonas deanei]CAD2215411.1 Kinesin motor domain containing protein, putative [Angomonas deanei]|eukprot:EPY20688.1 hypothetical protein AGDE_14528 [Angomonas deanei]
MRLILNGNQHRHTASTSMNDVSSRSHAIFALSLVQKKTSYTKDGSKKVTEKRSKINLVDLAGSERVRSTGAEGETLKEGAQINQSLSTLGLVISILADNSQAGKRARLKHVPYRDSTLTYLLKESLGGNSKTFMLSTVSPSVTQHDETLSTLRYADRAKAIVTRAFINESAGDKRIRELEDEVVRLREQIRSMENISNEQREAMLAQLMQTQRHHTSGSSSDSEEENVRQEGENPLDNLQQQLQHAEEVIRQLTATEEDRQRELRQALQADTIKLERKEPYLLNVDCVGKWIVAHFSCEETYLSGVTVEEGDEASAEVSSPTAEDGKPFTLFIPKDANDASIGAPHCMFQLIKETGAVFLVPLGGFSTFLNYSDTPVACRTLLRNGDVLSLGAPDGAQFRFTDPTDVPLTAGGARRTLSRPMASLSRPRDPSEPTITFDSVSPQTHEGTGGGRGYVGQCGEHDAERTVQRRGECTRGA